MNEVTGHPTLPFKPPQGLGAGLPFSSSQGASSPPDAFPVSGLAPDRPISQPEVSGPSGGAVYGNVSLDLYFSREDYLRAGYTQQGPDGVRSVRAELYRRFEAGLSLDFSFLARFNGAAEKLSQLDSPVFERWAATAQDLLDLKEKDFEEFVQATDELFNEIEKALGMGPDGLDHIAEFFSRQVDGFLDSVRKKMEYFDSHPLGQGEDLGLGIPGLLEEAKAAIPENLKQFIEELLAKINETLFNEDERSAILETLRLLQERARELFEEYQDKLLAPQSDEDETGIPPPSARGEDVQTADGFSFQVSYYQEQVSYTKVGFSYGAQAAPLLDEETRALPPVDVTA